MICDILKSISWKHSVLKPYGCLNAKNTLSTKGSFWHLQLQHNLQMSQEMWVLIFTRHVLLLTINIYLRNVCV